MKIAIVTFLSELRNQTTGRLTKAKTALRLRRKESAIGQKGRTSRV
jgi:hypothetical protein